MVFVAYNELHTIFFTLARVFRVFRKFTRNCTSTILMKAAKELVIIDENC